MGYNIIDIINKAISIENKRKSKIKSAIAENQVVPAVKLVSKILCDEIDKTIRYHEKLKEEIKNIEIEEIDIRTYDKMSFLINEFNNRESAIDVNNVRNYLKSELNLAKNKYSLFIDLQGRLVNNTCSTDTKTYKILSKIITNISNQISTIQKTII